MKKIISLIEDYIIILIVLCCFYLGYIIATRPDKVGIWLGTMSRYLDAASESERKVERQRVLDQIDNDLHFLSPIELSDVE